MASEKGYVQSASFFRTHPPYFERILSTLSEVSYLPKNGDLLVDSSTFPEFKAKLNKALGRERREDKKAPSLRPFPPCDDEEKPAAKPDRSEARVH
jgi:hypothetical protein